MSGAGRVLRSIATPHGPMLPNRTRDESRVLRVNSEWILFLYHSPSCRAGAGCKYGEGCSVGRALWAHILCCSDPLCRFRNCLKARSLLWHFWHCREVWCPLCAPVRCQLIWRL